MTAGLQPCRDTNGRLHLLTTRKWSGAIFSGFEATPAVQAKAFTLFITYFGHLLGSYHAAFIHPHRLAVRLQGMLLSLFLLCYQP